VSAVDVMGTAGAALGDTSARSALAATKQKSLFKVLRPFWRFGLLLWALPRCAARVPQAWRYENPCGQPHLAFGGKLA
jgi:hypothetical protein